MPVRHARRYRQVGRRKRDVQPPTVVAAQRGSHKPRLGRPVGLAREGAMPLDFAVVDVLGAPQLGTGGAQADEGGHKAAQPARVGVGRAPVHPVQRAVVAVGVVVAVLGVAVLVPHVQHGHARGQQQRGRQVAGLAVAQAQDGGVVGGAFDAAIPGQVMGFAVTRGEGRGGLCESWSGFCFAPRSPPLPHNPPSLSLPTHRFSSPLSSLCFSLYATKSASVNPSCAVTKLTDADGPRVARQRAPPCAPHQSPSPAGRRTRWANRTARWQRRPPRGRPPP